MDRDIQVSGLGIYGIAPSVKAHIMYVDDKAPTTWTFQIEIQVYNSHENSIILFEFFKKLRSENVQFHVLKRKQ